MAGSAYKGLTIRIGADTAGLSSALRGINSAIYKTQSQLNKLSKATKLDPTNLNVTARQIGALSEQAVNAAANILSLGDSIEKLGSIDAKGGNGSIADIARDADSVTLALEESRIALNKYNAELAKIYASVRQRTDGAVNLRAITNTGEFNEELLKKLKKNGDVTEDEYNAIMKLKPAWVEATNALSDYTDAAKLNELKTNLAAQEASFRAINQQIVQVSKNLATMDRYATMPDLGDDLKEVNDYLRLVGAASDTASNRFSQLDGAMKMDTSNLETAHDRADALAEAMQIAQMKSGLLKDRLSGYETLGIDKMADDFGSVAMEVEQSERAFVNVKTQLDMFKASGEKNVEEQKRLEAAVQAAQQRMDTAHACQQYNTLKAEVAEVDSSFVKMAQSVADITIPSETARTLQRMKTEFDAISKSLKSTEGDAKSLESALKLNPENVTIAATKMELLQEAERLAAEEGENLKQQLQEYDVSAIEKAADKDKSAMKQMVDSAKEYEEACERVRDIRTEMTDTQELIDTSESKAEIESLQERLGELKTELQEAKSAQDDAFKQFDLSKGRKEVQDLNTKLAQNEATLDRLYVAMQKTSQAKVIDAKDIDSSFGRIKDIYSTIQDSSINMRGLGDLGNELKDVTAALDDAQARFKELDDAANLDPNNLALAEDRSKALADATALAADKSRLLREAYAQFKPDTINEVALSTGKVSENMGKAERDVVQAFENMERAIENYKAAQKAVDDLPAAVGRTSPEKVESLRQEAARLKQEMVEAGEAAANALDNFNTAKATQEAEQYRVKIHECDATLADLRSQAQQTAAIEATPKFSKDWSDALKASVDRFERLDQAMKLDPSNLTVVAHRMLAMREASSAAEERISLLKERMKELESQGIDKAAKDMGNVAVATEKAEKAASEAKEKVETLQKEYDQAESKARALGTELARSGKGAAAYETTSRKVERLKQQLDEAKNAQKEADAAASMAHFCSEYEEAGTEVDELEAKIKSFSSSTSTGGFGKVTTAAVQAASEIGQVMRDLGQKIVTSSDEIDKSYRDLRKTFNAEEGDYQNLYDAAMQYSQGHVTSAASMLEMESIAAQLGVGLEGGATAVQTFAEACADLDVATDIDAESIALQLGQITNVMKDLEPNKARNFADALVRLGNNMPAQESSIMQIAQRLSAVGSTANFTTPQILGWAAAVASTGQRSEAAATGVSTTISNIQKAVSSGGDSLKQFAKVAGMSADEFADKWKSDPSEALKSFIYGLKDADDQALSELEKLGIEGVRVTQTLLGLANTVDSVDKATGMAENAFNGVADAYGDAGDAAREANTKAEGFSGTLAKLKNSADILAASFGESMVPWMQMATEWIQKLTDYINNLDDSTKNMAIAVGGAFTGLAIAEPVIQALAGHIATLVKGLAGITVGGLGKLVGAFSQLEKFESLPKALGAGLSGIFGNISSKIGGLASVIGAAATPIGLFVTAMAAAVAATAGFVAIKWYEAEQHAQEMSSLLDGMKNNADGLTTAMGELPSSFDDFSSSADKAKSSVQDFLDVVKQHNQTNADTRSDMENTIAQLDYYQSVVDKCAGKEEISAEKKLELENALKGIEEITGRVYSVEQVLTDEYENQAGQIESTKEAIDRLIEAKEREARLSAISDMYSDAVKAELQGEQAVKKAQKAYDQGIEDYAKTDPGKAVVKAAEQSGADVAKALELGFANTVKGEELTQSLNDAKEATEGLTEETAAYKEMYGQVLEEASKAGDYGVREWRIINDEDMRAAAEAVGLHGDALKDFCKQLEITMGDTAEAEAAFAAITSEQFAAMAEQSGGNIDDLVARIAAFAALDVPDKESAIILDDGSIQLATGEIYEWNGIELVPKEGSVEVTGTEEANAEIDATQANAEDGADLEVTTSDSELDETAQKEQEVKDNAGSANMTLTATGIDDLKAAADALHGLQDAQINVTFAIDDGGITEINDKLRSLEDEEVKVTIKADTSGADSISSTLSTLSGETTKAGISFDVDDSGIDDAKEKLKSIQDEEVKVSIVADTTGADTITNLLSTLSEKKIGVSIESNTAGVSEVTSALASVSDKPVSIDINADTTGAQQASAAIDAVPATKTASLITTADTGAVDQATAALQGVPVVTETGVVVTTSGVTTATTQISNLNAVSGAMQNQRKTYAATGNATTATPASHIKNLNSAALNMNSRSRTYTANGNAANGTAANHVWDLIHAVNNMSSKTITVTTNYVTNGSPGHSATGAYIPYNKIPRHAAGIFTHRTLTNIGWVGESGAELYSGNSLVPLTNRKYSMPYIDDISDAVAKKLGGMGTQQNVYINDARINDDEEIQAVVLNLIDVLQRKGAMNRG